MTLSTLGTPSSVRPFGHKKNVTLLLIPINHLRNVRPTIFKGVSQLGQNPNFNRKLVLVHVKETDKTQRHSEQLCWMANTPISQKKSPKIPEDAKGDFFYQNLPDVYLERNDFFSVILYHLFTCMYHVLFTKSQSMFYQ